MSVDMMINILRIILSLAMEVITVVMAEDRLEEAQLVSKECMDSLIKDTHRAPMINTPLRQRMLGVLDNTALQAAMADRHLPV